ncbi:Hypothetical predicted protein, partial [Xyrichtys novacula]
MRTKLKESQNRPVNMEDGQTSRAKIRFISSIGEFRKLLPPFTADIPAETATFPGRRLSDGSLPSGGPVRPSGSPRVPLLLLGLLPVRLQPVTSSPRTLRSTRRLETIFGEQTLRVPEDHRVTDRHT